MAIDDTGEDTILHTHDSHSSQNLEDPLDDLCGFSEKEAVQILRSYAASELREAKKIIDHAMETQHAQNKLVQKMMEGKAVKNLVIPTQDEKLVQELFSFGSSRPTFPHLDMEMDLRSAGEVEMMDRLLKRKQDLQHILDDAFIILDEDTVIPEAVTDSCLDETKSATLTKLMTEVQLLYDEVVKERKRMEEEFQKKKIQEEEDEKQKLLGETMARDKRQEEEKRIMDMIQKLKTPVTPKVVAVLPVVSSTETSDRYFAILSGLSKKNSVKTSPSAASRTSREEPLSSTDCDIAEEDLDKEIRSSLVQMKMSLEQYFNASPEAMDLRDEVYNVSHPSVRMLPHVSKMFADFKLKTEIDDQHDWEDDSRKAHQLAVETSRLLLQNKPFKNRRNNGRR